MRTIANPIGLEAQCKTTRYFLSELNTKTWFQNDSQNSNFKEAMWTLAKKNGNNRFCAREEFISLFRAGNQHVLFAAGPSGLGIPNTSGPDFLMTLGSLFSTDSDFVGQKKVVVLTGISQLESNAATTDLVGDRVAYSLILRNPQNPPLVFGAIAGKAYTYGNTNSDAFPSQLDAAYIPTEEDGQAGSDYKMPSQSSSLPVKAEAVMAALDAGNKVNVYLFDGGDVSFDEVSAILSAAQKGTIEQLANLSLHISMGWGFARADKIGIPASLRILKEFYQNPGNNIPKTSFSLGTVARAGTELPVSIKIISKTLQYRYLKHLNDGLKEALSKADEKKQPQLLKKQSEFFSFCQEYFREKDNDCSAFAPK